MKLLAEDIDPDEICSRLGLCPHRDLVDAHPAALLDHQASLPDEIQVRNPFFQLHIYILKQTRQLLQVAKWQDDTCALCEFAVSEVFDALNDTSDRRMVKNLLESVCYRLPNRIENACVKMVNEFSDPIIDAIVSNVNPDMASNCRICFSLAEVTAELTKLHRARASTSSYPLILFI